MHLCVVYASTDVRSAISSVAATHCATRINLRMIVKVIIDGCGCALEISR